MKPNANLPARHNGEAKRRPVLYQTWQDLAFIHWSIDPAEIAAQLPDQLTIDTFEGKAWLGIVPFFMRNIRPRFLPAVPGLSATPELNLRTYVRDSDGTPGVWFFSLNASNLVAVWFARTFFHLPYYRAKIVTGNSDGVIDYYCRRAGVAESQASRFVYSGTGSPAPAAKGTLAYFLVERYRLFARPEKSGRLYTARVAHVPYQIQKAELSVWDDRLFALDGLAQPNRPPDHVCYAAGVDVDIMPLKPLPTPAGGEPARTDTR